MHRNSAFSVCRPLEPYKYPSWNIGVFQCVCIAFSRRRWASDQTTLESPDLTLKSALPGP